MSSNSDDDESEQADPNGDSYTGQKNYEGQAHGFGTRKFKDGKVYAGYFRDGLPEGKGKITYANGDVFEGFMSNGECNGTGSLV